MSSPAIANSGASSSDDDDERKEADGLSVPDDLLDFLPSDKKREVSRFTEEFSFVILPHLALVVVYITSAETGMSGYCNDLRQAIKLKNSHQEPCPYIDFTMAETRDPIKNVCPGLWGPYSRVNDREEIIQEAVQTTNSRRSRSPPGMDPQSYPATCFILIPKINSLPARISVPDVEDQVQSMATYCNKVYATNQRNHQKHNHLPPRAPLKRTFGLARLPNRSNPAAHNGLPLNKFISRRHAVEFLSNAYGCDHTFYENKTGLAQRLLEPPHTLDEKQLGYPYEGF